MTTQTFSTIARREFLALSGLGAAALLADSVNATSATAADLEIALQATVFDAALWLGTPTRVWGYRGAVLRGDPSSVQPMPTPNRGFGYPTRLPAQSIVAPPRHARLPFTYLGPLISVQRGQRVRIHFTNQLPEATVMHWHGLHIAPEMDAHPSLLVAPGQSAIYEFEVTNRAGTYWFHPHPDGRTGAQVYQGLAGAFVVTDPEEQALGLPSGAYDLPLVLQDRVADAANQFVYLSRGGNGMMGNDGFLGDRILVNGQESFALPVARRAYRLRLLNGSNSRVYKLAWSDGTPLTVIGTDGGLLEQAVQRNYVMLAPGERIELWADFSDRAAGDELELRSLAFTGADVGMNGGNQTLPNGAPFRVMQVRVANSASEPSSLPARLSSITRFRVEDAVNRATPRSLAVTMGMVSGGMRWLLNGRVYQEQEVAANEVVQLNTTEVWELVNNSGMMGMSMVHPLHIHGLQFQVLERQIAEQFSAGYETVRYGYVDEGWKDTVMVMPGERVKVLLRFEDFTGKYVYHCHNLEHEDAGMMRNYLVRN